jgi:hypothetical protein
VVPTFSLDGGVQFERDAGFFGRTSPRRWSCAAFYVAPFRDRSRLPNYDSRDRLQLRVDSLKTHSSETTVSTKTCSRWATAW